MKLGILFAVAAPFVMADDCLCSKPNPGWKDTSASASGTDSASTTDGSATATDTSSTDAETSTTSGGESESGSETGGQCYSCQVFADQLGIDVAECGGPQSDISWAKFDELIFGPGKPYLEHFGDCETMCNVVADNGSVWCGDDLVQSMGCEDVLEAFGSLDQIIAKEPPRAIQEPMLDSMDIDELPELEEGKNWRSPYFFWFCATSPDRSVGRVDSVVSLGDENACVPSLLKGSPVKTEQGNNYFLGKFHFLQWFLGGQWIGQDFVDAATIDDDSGVTTMTLNEPLYRQPGEEKLEVRVVSDTVGGYNYSGSACMTLRDVSDAEDSAGVGYKAFSRGDKPATDYVGGLEP